MAAAYRPCRDPAGRTTEMEDSDIACLKQKYPFLADFSDAFIRSTGPGELMKMESTSIKIWEKERSKDCEERLANNKMAMASTVKTIPAGEDNKWSILYQGRFLAGAACLLRYGLGRSRWVITPKCKHCGLFSKHLFLWQPCFSRNKWNKTFQEMSK
jgi:hypothetical protein